MSLPTWTSLAQSDVPSAELERVCGPSPRFACRKVLEWTGSDTWAGIADFLFGPPLRVLLVVAIAWILNRIARRSIGRVMAHMKNPETGGRLTQAGLSGRKAPGPGLESVRANQRIDAIGAVLRSGSTTLIWAIALVTIVGELGVSLGPLLASAGIAGIAIGFGAQNLVTDFLSGIFMLIEDQYGVGDVIDVGDATGTVEGISLRTTRLRDVEGTLWHVPNGEIRRVGNKSQQWARALLDVGVGYSTDLARAQAVIKEVADEVWRDEAWASRVLDEPEVWGVEALADSSIAIRLVVKTLPGEQWKVRRELNGRLKARFDAEGIEIPFPQRTVWLRTDPTGAETPVIGTRVTGGDDAPVASAG